MLDALPAIHRLYSRTRSATRPQPRFSRRLRCTTRRCGISLASTISITRRRISSHWWRLPTDRHRRRRRRRRLTAYISRRSCRRPVSRRLPRPPCQRRQRSGWSRRRSGGGVPAAATRRRRPRDDVDRRRTAGASPCHRARPPDGRGDAADRPRCTPARTPGASRRTARVLTSRRTCERIPGRNRIAVGGPGARGGSPDQTS